MARSPKLAEVIDIRIARVKKLARAFFRDLGAEVTETDLVPTAFEFMVALRVSKLDPSPHTQSVISRHIELIDLLDTLRLERTGARKKRRA